VISSGVFHFFAPSPPHIPHRLGVAVSAMVIGSHYFSNQAASQVPNPLHIFPFCFSQVVSSWIATPSFPSQFRSSLIASSFFPRNSVHRLLLSFFPLAITFIVDCFLFFPSRFFSSFIAVCGRRVSKC
jgi:hypothetical protein